MLRLPPSVVLALCLLPLSAAGAVINRALDSKPYGIKSVSGGAGIDDISPLVEVGFSPDPQNKVDHDSLDSALNVARKKSKNHSLNFIVSTDESREKGSANLGSMALDTGYGKTTIYTSDLNGAPLEADKMNNLGSMGVLFSLAYLTPAQKKEIAKKGKLPFSSLPPKVIESLISAEDRLHADDLEEVRNYFHRVITKIVSSPNAYFKFEVYPEINLYKDNILSGKIYYSIKNNKLSFSSSRSLSTADITHQKIIAKGDYFAIAVPDKNIEALFKDKKVTLQKEKYSIGEIAKVLSDKTDVQIKATKEASPKTIGVSSGSWNTYQLLFSICAAQGLELRTVGKTLLFGKSDISTDVRNLKKNASSSVFLRQSEVRILKEFLDSARFNVRTMPFLTKNFLSVGTEPITALSPNEIETLKSISDGSLQQGVDATVSFGVSYDWAICDPNWDPKQMILQLDKESALASSGCEGSYVSIPPMDMLVVTEELKNSVESEGAQVYIDLNGQLKPLR